MASNDVGESMGTKEQALDRFLDERVEGYLFKDLETMRTAAPLERTGPGHVGYPMVMGCIAGIELLGLIARPAPAPLKNRPSDRRAFGDLDNFERFWIEYLYVDDDKRAALSRPIYKLVRHGLVHNFTTKEIVIVHKSTVHHLTRDGGSLVVGAAELFADLKRAYETRFKPVATGSVTSESTSRAQMAERLDELLIDNALEATEHASAIAELPAYPVAAPGLMSPLSSAGSPAFTTGARSN